MSEDMGASSQSEDRAVAASPSSTSVSPPSACELSADERSFLLYVETCCVDGGGLLVGVRMNADDHAAAARFVSLGLMEFGRIPAKLLNVRCEGLWAPQGVTHYAELHEEGWKLAHELRRRRALRRGPYAAAVFGHERTLERTAQVRRAETGTGSVHESAVRDSECAPTSDARSNQGDQP